MERNLIIETTPVETKKIAVMQWKELPGSIILNEDVKE